MKTYKKTIIGSVVTFIIGTSCCWLSSLAIWLGGISFVSVVVKQIENIQGQLILLSIVFGFTSIVIYLKNARKRTSEDEN